MTARLAGLCVAVLAAAPSLAHQPPGSPWIDDHLTIRGYADRDSINRGESVGLHISTTQPAYDLQIYRIGYAGGAGRELIGTVRGLPGANRAVPAPDAVNGTVACNWPLSYTLQTGADWKSGVYLVQALAGGTHGNIIVVVRDDGVPHDLLMEIPTATYQAYNNWGGKSLYDYNSTNRQRAYKVSFDRPYVDGNGSGQLFLGNYNLIRFLESNGYDVTYATSTDLHSRPEVLAGRKALVVDYHSEYWSAGMRDNVTAARDRGVSLAFFAANTVYGQIRFEDADRTVVCYRDAALDPLAAAHPELAAVNWRKPPVNRPENALLGVMFEWFVDYGVAFPWTVVNASHWIYAGTGLRDGDQIPGVVGDEWDRVYDNGATPAGLTVLAESHFPYTDGNGVQQTATHNASIYLAASGALVFAAGTEYWSLKLDDNEHRTLGVDVRVQQMTRNLLDRMIRSPAAGLAPGGGDAAPDGGSSAPGGDPALAGSARSGCSTTPGNAAWDVTLLALAATMGVRRRKSGRRAGSPRYLAAGALDDGTRPSSRFIPSSSNCDHSSRILPSTMRQMVMPRWRSGRPSIVPAAVQSTLT